jgi:hypothetical protein
MHAFKTSNYTISGIPFDSAFLLLSSEEETVDQRLPVLCYEYHENRKIHEIVH